MRRWPLKAKAATGGSRGNAERNGEPQVVPENSQRAFLN